MKKLAPFLVFLFIGISATSQVGVNTTEPTSTLDVNGTIRVRGVKNSNSIAQRIVGIDDQGNFVEVEVEDNLILENNTIRAVDRTSKIGDVFTLGLPIIDNLDLVILPGEPNRDKPVLRLFSPLGDMILTGLRPGTDGQMVYLYPSSGDLTIIPNSILSLFGNRIESNNNTVIPRYSMVRLIYDASRSKWIIMDN